MRYCWRMRCWRILLACFIGSALSDQISFADPAGNTKGEFGLVLVVRDNLGDFGRLYTAGWLWGLHAGIEQSIDDSKWTLGLGWTTFARGYYFASDISQVESTIDVTEGILGVTLRRSLWGESSHARLSAGGVALLSDVPIPPKMDRRSVGWYAGVGLDRRVFGAWSLSLETRYSRHSNGISDMNAVVGLTAGL